MGVKVIDVLGDIHFHEGFKTFLTKKSFLSQEKISISLLVIP